MRLRAAPPCVIACRTKYKQAGRGIFRQRALAGSFAPRHRLGEPPGGGGGGVVSSYSRRRCDMLSLVAPLMTLTAASAQRALLLRRPGRVPRGRHWPRLCQRGAGCPTARRLPLAEPRPTRRPQTPRPRARAWAAPAPRAASATRPCAARRVRVSPPARTGASLRTQARRSGTGRARRPRRARARAREARARRRQRQRPAARQTLSRRAADARDEAPPQQRNARDLCTGARRSHFKSRGYMKLLCSTQVVVQLVFVRTICFVKCSKVHGNFTRALLPRTSGPPGCAVSSSRRYARFPRPPVLATFTRPARRRASRRILRFDRSSRATLARFTSCAGRRTTRRAPCPRAPPAATRTRVCRTPFARARTARCGRSSISPPSATTSRRRRRAARRGTSTTA